MLKTLTIAAGLLLAAASAHADTFNFNKSHTQIYFSVNHFGFSTTQGLFRDFDGKLTLEKDKPTASTVSFTIRSASIDTQFEKRDTHIKSADFLNVEKFPTVTFESTKVETTGADTAKVTGNLTLLGVTKPVTLDVKLNKLAPSPITNKLTAGFTATGVVKRTEFGMSTYAPAIGDEVTIRIETEAELAS